jgi:hypothetical protein
MNMTDVGDGFERRYTHLLCNEKGSCQYSRMMFSENRRYKVIFFWSKESIKLYAIWMLENIRKNKIARVRISTIPNLTGKICLF